MPDCVLLTGGGTGGHLYPGFAVAEQIRKLSPATECFFVGSYRGIENKILAQSSYPYQLLQIGPLNGMGFKQSLKSLWQLPWAFLAAISILRRQRPKLVLGFGGYASAPVLLACWFLGVPYYLWEGNAVPGMVTRWLGGRARKLFLALPSEHPFYRKSSYEVLGVPTRFEAQAPQRSWRPGQRALRVFVFGGSQGSRAINELIWSLLDAWPQYSSRLNLQIYHQVGKTGAQQCQEYSGRFPFYEASEFVFDMKERYEWADLVICRTGASSISELTQMALPGIFIPLPTAADEHQKKNALWLQEQGAGLCLLQAEASVEKLCSCLEYFMEPDRYQKASAASAASAKRGAAEQMAAQVLAAMDSVGSAS